MVSRFAFEPVQPQSLAEQVAIRLRRAILSGELPSGSPLVEMQLANQFGTSRGPVREAIAELHREGLVTVLPRKGTCVSQLDGEELSEVYSLRCALEGLAVRLLVAQGNPENLQELRELVDQMRRAARDGDLTRLVDLECQFHLDLCRLSGHRRLLQSYRQLDGIIRMALTFDNATYQDLQQVAAEHEPIIDSIALGNATEAERQIWQHITASQGPMAERLARVHEYVQVPNELNQRTAQ